MRKSELIHLHSLLVEVRATLEDDPDVPVRFERYDAYDVGPYAIHRSKEEHHEAIVRLLDDLTDVLAAEAETTSDRESEPQTAR